MVVSASAHGSVFASSHSEDPERPHVAAVCPLTTAACITQITREPLSVVKSDACDDAALAHRSSSSKNCRIRAFSQPRFGVSMRGGFPAQRADRAGEGWLRGSFLSLLLRWASSLPLPSTGVSARLAFAANNIFHATERKSRVGLDGDRVWRFEPW